MKWVWSASLWTPRRRFLTELTFFRGENVVHEPKSQSSGTNHQLEMRRHHPRCKPVHTSSPNNFTAFFPLYFLYWPKVTSDYFTPAGSLTNVSVYKRLNSNSSWRSWNQIIRFIAHTRTLSPRSPLPHHVFTLRSNSKCFYIIKLKWSNPPCTNSNSPSNSLSSAGHIVLCSHSLRHHRGHPLNPLLQGVEPFPMSPVGGGPTVNSDSEQSDRGEDEDHLGSLEESVVGSSSMLMDSPSQSKEDELLLMAGDAPPPKEQLSIVKVKPGHELKLKCEVLNYTVTFLSLVYIRGFFTYCLYLNCSSIIRTAV